MPAQTAIMTSVDVDQLLAQEPAGPTAGKIHVGQEPVHPIRQIRIRQQLVPAAVIGTLWAGGAVAASQPDKAMPILSLYLSVAVLYWWVKGRRESDPYERQRRKRWTTIITVCGFAWLSVAAISTAGGFHGHLLVAAGTVLGIPYWIKNRISAPGPVVPMPAPAPAIVELAVVNDVDPIPSRWLETIGAPSGLLPGSFLHSGQRRGDTVAYPITLVGGKQTYRSVKQLEAQIASAFARSLAEIHVDPHPTGQEDRAILLVAVQARNPLQDTLIHPGYDKTYNPETGYATVGYHPDLGPTEWGLWVPGFGMCSGTLFGGPGAGKSDLGQQIGIAARRTGYLSVWQGCPVGGASFAGTIDHCDWPARSREGILEQLRGLSLVMDVHKAILGLRRKQSGGRQNLFVPTPTHPGVLLQIDEIHKVFQEDWSGRKECHTLAKRAVQEGRKFGVGLVLADQGMGLEVFSNDDVFRASAWGKNNIVLRLDSSSALTMVPRLVANPALLPESWPDGTPTVGLGYSVGRRAAMMRTLFTPDPSAEMTAVPAVGLSRAAANKLGEVWVRRFERAEEDLGQHADMIAGLDPDLLDELVADDPSLAEALTRYRARPKPAPTQTMAPARAAGGWWDLPAPQLTVVREPEHPVLRAAGVRRVHELVCSGVHRTGEIIAHASLGESTVHSALKALEEAGLLRKRRHGEWEKAA